MTDEPLKLLAFAEFLHNTTVDSTPVASELEVRRIVAAVTSKCITSNDAERTIVTTFRKVRQVAEACNDPQLLRAGKTAQGWRRSRRQGVQRPVEDIAEFLEWGQLTSTVTLVLSA